MAVVLFGLYPSACDTGSPSGGESMQMAVARVGRSGLSPRESAVAMALESDLESWEIDYLGALDWSRLTAEGVAADPVFQHAFRATGALATARESERWLGVSVAQASCEIVPGAADCAHGLLRAAIPAFSGGTLLSACGTIDATVIGVPLGVACTAIAMSILSRAADLAESCSSFATRQLAALLECVDPSAHADDYIDFGAQCEARGRSLCPGVRACFVTSSSECPTAGDGGVADAAVVDAGVSDGGAALVDADGPDTGLPDAWIDPTTCLVTPLCTTATHGSQCCVANVSDSYNFPGCDPTLGCSISHGHLQYEPFPCCDGSGWTTAGPTYWACP